MRFPFASVALAAVLASAGAAAGEAPVYDQVSLSVSAQEEVSNDLLVAILYAQREGARQAEVADGVNTAMRAALDVAKATATVKVQTLGYSTSPVYNRESVVGWRARQSLRLESRDHAALTALVGRLQDSLAVESIGYGISTDARQGVEDRLIASALAAFRKRADLIAREMGRRSYRIVRADVGTSGYQPPMPLRAMAMRADVASVAPPAVEAGSQAVAVTVSGTIELTAAQ
ncbi:MAG: SIMPL domain-containing protein [Gammaproteobacteria bacterium]